MEAKKLVGWNVRKHRVARNMTLEDVAVAARTNASYVAEVERGEANIGIELLAKLAHALGLKPADLFIEPKPGEKPPAPLKAGRRPQRKPAIRSSLHLPEQLGHEWEAARELPKGLIPKKGRAVAESLEADSHLRKSSTAKPSKPLEQTPERGRAGGRRRNPQGLIRGRSPH